MKILIVDDSKDFCTTVADIIHSFGYDTENIQNPEEAIRFIEKYHRFLSLVLLDIEFGTESTMNGIDVLRSCRKHFPSLPVVMISGKGTIDTAVQATKLGALNFIEKGVLNKERLKEVIDSCLDTYYLKGESKEIIAFLESQDIYGSSKQMLDLGDSIIRYGRTDLNILITGETGTGKKLVAKAIHSVSRRSKYQFVTVDLPNIPRELFQSELFGHIKGSFSGAVDNKKGLFQQGNKGTIFLDEIGDLSLELQSNLFIPIEEKTIRKVGSTESEELDIRFISATDQDLLIAMRESKFREQLYHRLRECEIHIPPLRERPEDIQRIAEYYLKLHNQRHNESKFIAPSTMEFLKEQKWGGNIRELNNVLHVCFQTTPKEQIEVSDIHKIFLSSPKSNNVYNNYDNTTSEDDVTLEEIQAEAEKKAIENALERFNGNVSRSAAFLRKSRETLHNKIRKYKINTEIYRKKTKD